MTSSQRSGFDPPESPTFSDEEAAMLKEFAAASLSGRLWMCRLNGYVAACGHGHHPMSKDTPMPRLPSLILALALSLVVVAHGARAGEFNGGAGSAGGGALLTLGADTTNNQLSVSVTWPNTNVVHCDTFASVTEAQ